MPGPHLTPMERARIETHHEAGMSCRAIARAMGRSPATISRELRRNTTRRGYRAERAQALYEQRRKDCRPSRRIDYTPLWSYVKDKILSKGWSPEQVAGRLPLEYPGNARMRISHETIYQTIYGQDNLHYLIQYLPQARPKRRKKGQGKSRRAPAIPNRNDIQQRPESVQDRNEIGHWEGDLVVGKNQDGFILTLVERVSRLCRVVKLQTRKAAQVAQAAIDALLDMPVSWVKTITFDNGSEFADHERIARELGVDVYFAAPYAAYQRGTNENTNGLWRRFLPKGTSFIMLKPAWLNEICQQLNNRPRKCLGYRTPYEVFQKQRKEHRVALSS